MSASTPSGNDHFIENLNVPSRVKWFLNDLLINPNQDGTIDLTCCVHLNENQLDDQCIKSIGEYIKDNSSLNELDLENNLITDEGVKMLTKYLFGNTTLKTLGLACNKKITNKSYSILVDVCQMTKIEDLNTFGTLITGRKLLDIQYIKSISSGTLEILDVQALGVETDHLTKFCEIFKSIPPGSLKEIELSSNRITSAGVNQFLDTLTECNVRITKLSLAKNLIDDSCAYAFGKYFEMSNTLVSLNLGWNEISNNFIQQVAPSLKGNSTLKSINLNGNSKLTNKCIPFLIDVLVYSQIEDLTHVSTSLCNDIDYNILMMHKSIKSNKNAINFFGCKVDDINLVRICEEADTYGRKHLQEIRLGSNSLTSKGVRILTQFLKQQEPITTVLSLSHNQLNDDCIDAIGECLKYQNQLRHLDVAHNQISDIGVQKLSTYLIGNTSLRQLELSGNTKITTQSMPTLLEIIASSCIETLYMHGTSITEYSRIYLPLATNVLKNKSSSLHVTQKEFTDTDISIICEEMKKYRCENLRLLKNIITSTGAIHLLNCIRDLSSKIETLELHGNQLDDTFMNALGEFIFESQTIKTVAIGGNKITDQGIEVLADRIAGNSSLSTLSLYDTPGITVASLPYLMDIATRTCVQYIPVYNSSIGYREDSELQKQLKTPIETRLTPIKSNTKSAAKLT